MKEQILKELKEIKKETTYNYQYSYLKEDHLGNFKLDSNLCNQYGEKRDGYEKFRRDNSDRVNSVEYSGIISLRKVFSDNEDMKNVYIMEEKLSYETYSERLSALERKTKKYVIDTLNIIDLDAFQYFISDNLQIDFRNNETDTMRNVEFYMGIIEEYNSDEEFKHYFDKIIK